MVFKQRWIPPNAGGLAAAREPRRFRIDTTLVGREDWVGSL